MVFIRVISQIQSPSPTSLSSAAVLCHASKFELRKILVTIKNFIDAIHMLKDKLFVGADEVNYWTQLKRYCHYDIAIVSICCHIHHTHNVLNDEIVRKGVGMGIVFK